MVKLPENSETCCPGARSTCLESPFQDSEMCFFGTPIFNFYPNYLLLGKKYRQVFLYFKEALCVVYQKNQKKISKTQRAFFLKPLKLPQKLAF